MEFQSISNPVMQPTGVLLTVVTAKGSTGQFLATSSDPEDYGRNLFTRAMAGEFGPIMPYIAPEPTPEQVRAEITNAIQRRLDGFAQTRGYDSILSACSYATSGNVRFATEGQYCVDARDAHWMDAYAILADVEAGTRPLPTVDEMLSEMPTLEWPQ